MEFQLDGQVYAFIIPPTYSTETDKRVIERLTGYLDEHGYKIFHAILPEKPLAVQSGLAAYGRNNITYINGWGSFFRLTAYYSDMPCNTDHWDDYVLLDQCANCNACIKKCPTNAISNAKIRVLAERCLTFINEGMNDFPDWVDPGWHQCLIGCMVCQDVCPVNKKFTPGYRVRL